MSDRPTRLEDLYREAMADGGGVSAKWIGHKARAAGRKVVAESRLKMLESLQLTVEMKAFGMPSDAAHDLIMQSAPSATELGAVHRELADAVEALVFAEGVIEAMSRTPLVALPHRQQTQSPAKAQGGKS